MVGRAAGWRLLAVLAFAGCSREPIATTSLPCIGPQDCGGAPCCYGFVNVRPATVACATSVTDCFPEMGVDTLTTRLCRDDADCTAGAGGTTLTLCFPDTVLDQAVRRCRRPPRENCDPMVRGSCGAGRTCSPLVGAGAGACFPSCDPFAQDCAMGVCYATTTTGEGYCAMPYATGGDGAKCDGNEGCARGFGCRYEENAGFICRGYCGGPLAVGCAQGAACVDLSSTVPAASAGVCVK